jgi:phenylalanyl-tRNA synthetase alpha chain
MSDAKALLKKAVESVSKANSISDLEQVKLAYLGKKGQLSLLLSQIGNLQAEERKNFATDVNQAKQQLIEAIEQRYQVLKALETEQKLSAEKLDVHLPGEAFQVGNIHPISATIQRIEDIFSTVGFEVAEGLEIEDDFHNFSALNIAQNHPARAMHDTFYFNSDLLLRTHTSSVQIRSMTNAEPPFKIIAPGRVYRCDSDQTHTPMFHQVEGLLIDKHVSFADLHAMLSRFLQLFFEDDSLKVRFRPSYFPFTEPSAEVDISAKQLGGDDWLEVLGCGMVHPNVLANVGIDPDKWGGYAFGLGVERLAMLYYEVPDIRQFFSNDLRFLKQFS